MNVLAVNDQSRAFGPGFFVGARGFRVEPGGGRWVVGGGAGVGVAGCSVESEQKTEQYPEKTLDTPNIVSILMER